MGEGNSLAALLASINKTFDLAKAVREAAAASGGGDVSFRIADLIATIVDSKLYVAQTEALVQEKERRIAELEHFTKSAGATYSGG